MDWNRVSYDASWVCLKCLNRKIFCSVVNAADKHKLICRKLSFSVPRVVLCGFTVFIENPYGCIQHRSTQRRCPTLGSAQCKWIASAYTFTFFVCLFFLMITLQNIMKTQVLEDNNKLENHSWGIQFGYYIRSDFFFLWLCFSYFFKQLIENSCLH